MRRLRRLWQRLGNVVLRRRHDERLREEADWHVEMETEANLRAGLPPVEARRQARLSFGSLEATRERFHEEEGLPVIENLLLDYRSGLQALRLSPIFSTVALLSLTLVIAVNVFVFSVGRSLLTSPLGISRPDKVYQLRPSTWENWKLLTTSLPVFIDLRQRNRTFVDLAGVNGYSHGAMEWAGKSFQVQGDEVTGNYFSLLGVTAQLGSSFSLAGSDASTIVLSNDLWHKAFTADPGIIGKTVLLGKHSYRIIGVAPATFHGTERLSWPDYWSRLEISREGSDTNQRSATLLTVLGRLRDDSSIQAATTDLDAISRQLSLERPETDKAEAYRLVEPGLFGDMRKVVWDVLLKVALFACVVLLAGMVNLSCLLAARFAHRGREMGFRLSLGSTFARLAQQLTIENAILCVSGGGLGTLLALGLLAAARKVNSTFGTIRIPLHATALMMGLFFTGTCLVLLTVPVLLYLCREKLQRSRPHALGFELAVQESKLRDFLLIGQIALCTLLAAASVISVDRVLALRSLHLGFVPYGVSVATFDSDNTANTGVDPRALLAAITQAPQVAAAGAISRLPMTGGLQGVPVFRQNAQSHVLAYASATPYVFSISPGYLHAAGTALLSGRDILWSDDASHARIAVVNSAFARQLWGQQHVEGRIFQLEGQATTIVGVVEDGDYHDLDEEHHPVVFRSIAQQPSKSFALLVRTGIFTDQVRKSLADTLHRLAPSETFIIHDWSESLRLGLFPSQVEAFALGINGTLAALLAMTGVAGAVAYNVEIRSKELAIRIALGARRAHLLLVASGRPLSLLLVGIVLGYGLGISAERVLVPNLQRSILSMPQLLLISATAILGCGVSASVYPVWKVTQLEPSEVIRQE